jgi:hypothetical protein
MATSSKVNIIIRELSLTSRINVRLATQSYCASPLVQRAVNTQSYRAVHLASIPIRPGSTLHGKPRRLQLFLIWDRWAGERGVREEAPTLRASHESREGASHAEFWILWLQGPDPLSNFAFCSRMSIAAIGDFSGLYAKS